MRRLFLFCWGYVWSFSTYAEVAQTNTGSLTTSYMASLLLSLGLVVAIIIALAWLVRRFKILPQQNHNMIKVISTLSLGPRDRLALIQVGKEQLLIAISPGKIAKLHHLDTPVEIQEAVNTSFKSQLNDVMGQQQYDTVKQHDSA